MVIAVILSALAGVVGGWLLCTLISGQLAGKSFAAELSAEDKQVLADVKTEIAVVQAHVSTLLHMTVATVATAAATPPAAAAPTAATAKSPGA